MKSGIFNRIANDLSHPEKLSRAIEALKPVQRRKKEGYIAPQTELQQSLASLWAEFLKIDVIGLEDNFFEMGGDSLLAMRISFQVREKFNVDFALGSFLMTPVLRMQSERIEEMLFKQADEGKLEQLLGEIELEGPEADSSYLLGKVVRGISNEPDKQPGTKQKA